MKDPKDLKSYVAADSRTLSTADFDTKEAAQEWCDNMNKEHGLFCAPNGEWYDRGQPTMEAPATVYTKEEYLAFLE